MRGKVHDMSNNEVYDNETLHQYLRGAIENGQAPKAFQLVEELIARRYPERITRKQHTRFQSTGALDDTLSMLSVKSTTKSLNK